MQACTFSYPEKENGLMDDLPQPWIKTPCPLSEQLSAAAGCQVFTKLEFLQPSGSFKSRGVGNLMWQTARESRSRSDGVHFFSSSRGNAGLAAAVTAGSLGQQATVVVPEMTDPKMVSRIRCAGAEVIVHGESLSEADDFVRAKVAANPECCYVSPYDHKLIWEGNSSIIDEIAEQWEGPAPDAIVCSVGGGGLLNGIMLGLDRHGWGDQTTVLALETEGADCLSRSLKAGRRVAMPKITSIAKSLGVSSVSTKTWDFIQQGRNIRSAVLPDADAARGCIRFAADQGVIVEPACGVCLAICYQDLLRHLLPNFGPTSRVVVVVCGGSSIDAAILAEYDRTYGRVTTGSTEHMDTLTVDGIPYIGREELLCGILEKAQHSLRTCSSVMSRSVRLAA